MEGSANGPHSLGFKRSAMVHRLTSHRELLSHISGPGLTINSYTHTFYFKQNTWIVVYGETGALCILHKHMLRFFGVSKKLFDMIKSSPFYHRPIRHRNWVHLCHGRVGNIQVDSFTCKNISMALFLFLDILLLLGVGSIVNSLRLSPWVHLHVCA